MIPGRGWALPPGASANTAPVRLSTVGTARAAQPPKLCPAIAISVTGCAGGSFLKYAQLQWRRFHLAGCTSSVLEVAVNNKAALAFYKKHSYSVLKVLRRYYPNGLDGFLMGKQLRPSK